MALLTDPKTTINKLNMEPFRLGFPEKEVLSPEGLQELQTLYSTHKKAYADLPKLSSDGLLIQLGLITFRSELVKAREKILKNKK